MLVIILRTVIILFCLVVVLRLMGKREIGELQPFEFVITLVIAELACTPMQDVSVPISYGLVPIAVVFILHFSITKLSSHFINFRKIVNGKPMIIVNEQGIDLKNLKRLNVHVNDLMQNLRSSEYFTIPEVRYVIIENNGTISILPEENAYKPKSIPLSIVVEGKYLNENLKISSRTKEDYDKLLKESDFKLKDVVLMSVYDGKTFIQPKNGKYVVLEDV